MSKYERLTRRDGEAIWVGSTKYLVSEKTNLRAILHRLAQYEDIGSPEEFAELAKAKAEGRLVELPCKVGDTLYWVSVMKSGINRGKVKTIRINANGVDLEIITDTKQLVKRDLGNVYRTREEAEWILEGLCK